MYYQIFHLVRTRWASELRIKFHSTIFILKISDHFFARRRPLACCSSQWRLVHNFHIWCGEPLIFFAPPPIHTNNGLGATITLSVSPALPPVEWGSFFSWDIFRVFLVVLAGHSGKKRRFKCNNFFLNNFWIF